MAMTLSNRLDLERRKEQEDQLVSLAPDDVAGLLGVSRSSVDRLLRRGHLRSFKVGARARRVKIIDLEEFIEGGRSK